MKQCPLAIVTPLFSPIPSNRRIENFNHFIARLPLSPYVIEAAFTNSILSRCPVVRLNAYDDNFLWQKERLINLAVSLLPSHVKFVAWIDADIIFSDNYWVDEAITLLTDTPVIQLYDVVAFLDVSRNVTAHASGFLAQYARVGNEIFSQAVPGQPGMALAARREFFEGGGLLETMVVGGGDIYLAQALVDQWSDEYLARLTPEHREHTQNWAALISRRFGKCTKTLRQQIYHLYHGAFINRRYKARYRILTDHAFDPATDIAVDSNGLLRWCSPKQDLHREVQRYFASRDEDSE